MLLILLASLRNKSLFARVQGALKGGVTQPSAMNVVYVFVYRKGKSE